MFDEPMIKFLHSGCSLLVGTVDHAGAPHAGRGWGLTVSASEPTRVRLLVDAADASTVENLRPGVPVAICTADVRTLRSVQVKGRVVAVEPATEADVVKQQQYTADFTTDINETDGDDMAMLRRWSDRQVVACLVDLTEVFDQTPGPSAGSRLDGAST